MVISCLQAILLLSVPYTQITWQGEIIPEAQANMHGSQTHEFLYFTPSLKNLHLASSGGISCALREKKYMHNSKLLESAESCPAPRKNNPFNPRTRKVSSWSIKQWRLLSWHLKTPFRHGTHISTPIRKGLPQEGGITSPPSNLM